MRRSATTLSTSALSVAVAYAPLTAARMPPAIDDESASAEFVTPAALAGAHDLGVARAGRVVERGRGDRAAGADGAAVDPGLDDRSERRLGARAAERDAAGDRDAVRVGLGRRLQRRRDRDRAADGDVAGAERRLRRGQRGQVQRVVPDLGLGEGGVDARRGCRRSRRTRPRWASRWRSS